jgi:hypothetical protein
MSLKGDEEKEDDRESGRFQVASAFTKRVIRRS